MANIKNKVTKTVRFDRMQDKDIIEWWDNQANQTNSIRRILRSVIRDSGQGDYFEAQDRLIEHLKAELAGTVQSAPVETKPAAPVKQTKPVNNTSTTWPKSNNAAPKKSDNGGGNSGTDLLGIKL